MPNETFGSHTDSIRWLGVLSGGAKASPGRSPQRKRLAKSRRLTIDSGYAYRDDVNPRRIARRAQNRLDRRHRLHIGNYDFEPDPGEVRQKHGLTAVMRLVNPRHRDVQTATLTKQFTDRVQLRGNENGFNFLHRNHRASVSDRGRFLVEWLSRLFVYRDVVASSRM
jgi:hypothetical protein